MGMIFMMPVMMVMASSNYWRLHVINADFLYRQVITYAIGHFSGFGVGVFDSHSCCAFQVF